MSCVKHIHRPIALILGFAPVLCGCFRSGGPEWKWQRCFTGPRRDLTEVAVVLAPRDPCSLQLRSVDGKRVREVQEYHVLPGTHTLLLELRGIGCGYPALRLYKWSGEPATIAPTLERGCVYRLAADLAWGNDVLPEGKACQREWSESSGKPSWSSQLQFTPGVGWGSIPRLVAPVWRHRERGQWVARIEELGAFTALRDDLAHQQASTRRTPYRVEGPSNIPWPYLMWGWGIRPPKHWLSAGHEQAPQ